MTNCYHIINTSLNIICCPCFSKDANIFMWTGLGMHGILNLIYFLYRFLSKWDANFKVLRKLKKRKSLYDRSQDRLLWLWSSTFVCHVLFSTSSTPWVLWAFVWLNPLFTSTLDALHFDVLVDRYGIVLLVSFVDPEVLDVLPMIVILLWLRS